MKIKELSLYTADLDKQIQFYEFVLGLQVVERSSDQAKFTVGNSHLILKTSHHFRPYHFAINIPSNQEHEALEWLKNRVDILKDGDLEIQEFESWNAKAIYFYDADQNIVELIARKNLNCDSNKIFSSSSFLSISEIGVPVKDIALVYHSIHDFCGIEIYDGGLERFCALGDEHGLFICINKEAKDWFPTGEEAFSAEFSIIFEYEDIDYQLEFVDESVVIDA